MTNDVPSKALTEIEATQYIGMSRSWLAQARTTGNPDAPPFLKIGRCVRYLREDLDRWLEGRRQTNTLRQLGVNHPKTT